MSTAWQPLPFTASTHLVVCVEEDCEYTRWTDGSPRADEHALAGHGVAVFRFEGELAQAASAVAGGPPSLPPGRKRAFRHVFGRPVGRVASPCSVLGCTVQLGVDGSGRRIYRADAVSPWRSTAPACRQEGRA